MPNIDTAGRTRERMMNPSLELSLQIAVLAGARAYTRRMSPSPIKTSCSRHITNGRSRRRRLKLLNAVQRATRYTRCCRPIHLACTSLVRIVLGAVQRCADGANRCDECRSTVRSLQLAHSMAMTHMSLGIGVQPIWISRRPLCCPRAQQINWTSAR